MTGVTYPVSFFVPFLPNCPLDTAIKKLHTLSKVTLTDISCDLGITFSEFHSVDSLIEILNCDGSRNDNDKLK